MFSKKVVFEETDDFVQKVIKTGLQIGANNPFQKL
jgi:hypothetical protein